MAIRSLVGVIAGYDDSITRLETLQLLLKNDADEISKEIKRRIEFIELKNAPGKKSCKRCHGYGGGADGRGDPWTCYDCKPELKTFWDDI